MEPLLLVVAIFGVGYLLKNGKYILDLKKKVSQLEKDKINLKEELEAARLSQDQFKYIDLKKSLQELENKIRDIKEESEKLNSKKSKLNEEIIEIEDLVLMQDFGIYETKYGLENSQLYKERLDEIRIEQKQMIRQKVATNHSLTWTHKKKGKEFILGTIKLSLKAFNNECDNIIMKAKYNNIDVLERRIYRIFKDINTLTHMQNVSIKQKYLKLKLEELYLKYEYECKLQEEKEQAEQAEVDDYRESLLLDSDYREVILSENI